VPAGATSMTFTVPTDYSINDVYTTETASLGNQVFTTHIVVRGVAMRQLNPNEPTMGSNSSLQATVVLNGQAPPSGFLVALSSSNPDVISVPATFTIPAGAYNGNFTMHSSKVTTPTAVTISATSKSLTLTTTVTVNP
jgi:hypothetical protein